MLTQLQRRVPALLAALAPLLPMILAGCSSEQASRSCLEVARFDQTEYTTLRIIDGDSSSSALSARYGPSIGTATTVPCDDDLRPERWAAYRMPGVDPAEAVVVDAGAVKILVPDDLIATPAKWTAALTNFVDAHPAATDM